MSEERNYSEITSEAIDAEVRRISDELCLRAKTIPTRRRIELERIAAELTQNSREPDIALAGFRRWRDLNRVSRGDGLF